MENPRSAAIETEHKFVEQINEGGFVRRLSSHVPNLSEERVDAMFENYKAYKALKYPGVEWDEKEFGESARDMLALFRTSILSQKPEDTTSVFYEHLLLSYPEGTTPPVMHALHLFFHGALYAYYMADQKPPASQELAMKVADMINVKYAMASLRIPLSFVSLPDEPVVGVSRFFGIPVLANSFIHAFPFDRTPEPLHFGHMVWSPAFGKNYRLDKRRFRKLLENELAKTSSRAKARKTIKEHIGTNPGVPYFIHATSGFSEKPAYHKEETVQPRFNYTAPTKEVS